MYYLLTILSITLPLGGVGGGLLLLYRHQCLLRDRAFLIREAIRNKDFSFTLPPFKGGLGRVFFGERALQQALNDLGKDINQLVAQNEVESWQRLTRVLTHEIMNATAPIQSISQAYLASPKIKDTPYEEGIRAIYDTTTGLSEFVDSYRKLTQLQKANITELPLLPFVETIKALYNDVEWDIDIPSSVTIQADENLMRQVLINIIKNAIEASAKTIGIRYKIPLHSEAEREGSGWVSGRGFSSHQQQRRTNPARCAQRYICAFLYNESVWQRNRSIYFQTTAYATKYVLVPCRDSTKRLPCDILYNMLNYASSVIFSPAFRQLFSGEVTWETFCEEQRVKSEEFKLLLGCKRGSFRV